MSVTSMNSRMAMAEKLSIPQLQQAIQSGSLPAYIGVPLIEQKTREKSQMAAASQGQQEPKSSITQQILQQAEQQQQAAPGIDQLASNLPQENDSMGMANGGIIAFADEGQVVDPDAPTRAPAAAPIPMSTYGGIPALSPEAQAMFAENQGYLKELRGQGKSERENAKGMAIFQAGLGMMGGTSPNAFANISAGAMPAVTQYQSALKDLRKDDRDSIKQLLDLGVSKEKFMQEVQKMGIDVYKADQVYKAHELSANATLGAAAMRTSAEKQPRAPNPTDIANAYIDGKTQQYTAQGMEPNAARVLAQEDYYAQSRPLQPTPGMAPAIINAEKEDPVLDDLRVQLNRAKGKPEEQKRIQERIDARSGVVAGRVSGYGTSGRGAGGAGNTNPPRPPAPQGNNPPAAARQAPSEAVNMLRQNPSPANRSFFDQTFGAGAAERALTR